MQNKSCAPIVRTNKSERLFMRCTPGYKQAVDDMPLEPLRKAV